KPSAPGGSKKSPGEVIVPGPASQAAEASAPSTQSARSIADGEAPMGGVATTRSMERVAAAVGALEGAETRFERADDVAHGGVLCALAALLAFGLLRHAQSHFSPVH
ncbi:MAG: putative transposase, partial [Spartobacteria bacterium]